MARSYVKHKTKEESQDAAKQQRARWNRENYKRFSIAVTHEFYEKVERRIQEKNIPSKRQYVIGLIEEDLKNPS